MPVTPIKIKGRKWTVKRPVKIVHAGEACDGLCDYETRTISILKTLTGIPELSTTIHECRHATSEFLSEDFVDDESEQLAIALWALGYRRLAAAEIRALEQLRG